MAAAHRETLTSRLTLSPLRSKKRQQGSKAASLETCLFFAWRRAVESGALSIALEASLLSCSIINPSAVSQETEGPAVHSIHPDTRTSPSKWYQPALCLLL